MEATTSYWNVGQHMILTKVGTPFLDNLFYDNYFN